MKYNTEKVKDIKVSQEYKWTIEQQLRNQPLQDNDDIEETWKNIKQSIHKAAKEVFGMSQPKRRNGWFDVECQKAVNIRNEARMKMIQRETRANTLEYTNARKEVKANLNCFRLHALHTGVPACCILIRCLFYRMYAFSVYTSTQLYRQFFHRVVLLICRPKLAHVSAGVPKFVARNSFLKSVNAY
jgi:hypothetical protein